MSRPEHASRAPAADTLIDPSAALRDCEQRYYTLVDSIDQGYCVLEVLFDAAGAATDYRFLEVNRAFTVLSGLEDAVGRRIRELFPRHEEHWFETFGRVARTGRAERFESQAEHTGDRWFDLYAFPAGPPGAARVGVLFADVTERKRAEADLFSSRQALRAVLDTIPQRVFWKGPDLRYLGCNRPFARDMGYDSPDEVVGKTDYQATWAAAAGGFRSDDRSVIDSATPKLDFEEELPAADGQISWVRTSKVPLYGPGGQVSGVLGTYEDVTERKRAEAAVRAAEVLKGNLLALSDAIRSLDDPVAVQEAAARTLGERLGLSRAYYCEVDESVGIIRIARDFVRGEVPSLVGEYPLAAFGWVGPAFRAGRPMVVESVAATPLLAAADRPPLAALQVGAFVAVPLVRGGRLVALLCATDVAPRAWAADELELVYETAERTWSAVARARAEVAVHESEARFRTLLETLPDAVMIHAGGRVTYCNAAGLRLFGAGDRGRLIGQLTTALHPSASLVRSAPRTTRTAEEVVTRLNGQTAPVHVTVLPIADGGAAAVLVVLRDLTEQRQVAAQLREQDLMLREAAELAHVGGWSFDPVTMKGDWTAETARIHGVAPTAALDAGDSLHRFEGEDRARLDAALRGAIEHGSPYDLELDLRAATGEKKRVRAICRPVVEGGRVVRVRGSLQDVTERHLLAERLRQSQKMEAFGQLAGGVAHDFNNLLTVINGYSALLLKGRPAEHPDAEPVGEILAAGKRAADLTRQLLAFGRRQVLQPRELDLNDLITNLLKMLGRLLGEDVRVSTALSPDLGTVTADPGQIEQVLINLCVNARDAMPTGGRLTITTAPVDVRRGAAAPHSKVPPGRYVRFAVADTGCGMTDAVKEQMFEPFFTTKPVGQGTGLGLSTVLGIVEQSGGHITVSSAVGHGTTFEVCLPVTAIESGIIHPASESRASPGGRETVLLVEDERSVRRLTAALLRGAGYTVLEADGGAEAARVHATAGGAVRLLVTDVVMPHESGRELAERLTRASPGLRVLFMSGFTDDRVMRHGIQSSEVAFIQKPFEMEALLEKVREVLDRAEPG